MDFSYFLVCLVYFILLLFIVFRSEVLETAYLYRSIQLYHSFLFWCLIYLCHMLFTKINAAAAATTQPYHFATPSQYSLLICSVTLSRPLIISSLKITNNRIYNRINVFIYAPPCLWNQLQDLFRPRYQSSWFTSSYSCQAIFVIITILSIHYSLTLSLQAASRP